MSTSVKSHLPWLFAVLLSSCGGAESASASEDASAADASTAEDEEASLLGLDQASTQVFGITIFSAGEVDNQHPWHDLESGDLSALAVDDEGTLYIWDDKEEELVIVNPTTSAETRQRFYPPGTRFRVSGLTWAPSERRLYVFQSSGRAIFRYDPGTASLEYIGNPEVEGQVTSLAFDPSSNTLYGLSMERGSLGTESNSYALYTFDIQDGSPTLVGAYQCDEQDCQFEGLAWDSQTRALFASDTRTNSLFRIDRVDGSRLLVGPLGHADVTGLAPRP